MNLNRCGFTILELSLTVTVLALLLAITLGSFKRYAQPRELRHVISRISSVLEEAKQEARSSGGNVALILEEEKGGQSLGYASFLTDETLHPVTHWYILPESIQIDVNSSPEYFNVFNLQTALVGKDNYAFGIRSDGALITWEEGRWISFCNSTSATAQKGAYFIVQDAAGRKEALYLSPLTGIITTGIVL